MSLKFDNTEIENILEQLGYEYAWENFENYVYTKDDNKYKIYVYKHYNVIELHSTVTTLVHERYNREDYIDMVKAQLREIKIKHIIDKKRNGN